MSGPVNKGKYIKVPSTVSISILVRGLMYDIASSLSLSKLRNKRSANVAKTIEVEMWRGEKGTNGKDLSKVGELSTNGVYILSKGGG